jgi:putative DNA primase/helicase
MRQATGIEFEKIKAAANINPLPIVERLVPGGTIRGAEYVARLRADDHDPSFKFNLAEGVWSDFGANISGDIIDLYAHVHGIDNTGKAALALGDEINALPPEALKPVKYNDNRDVCEHRPLPQNPPPFDGVHWKLGPARPEHIWEYRDADGRPIGYTCRFDMPNGGKDIFPITWCYNKKTRKTGWYCKGFANPRPLYGLDVLSTAAANMPVLVVEGEKTCEAARRLLPQVPCITWPGGGKAVKHVDFSPLAGRRVFIWPDADPQGEEAALAIAARLRNVAAGVKIITPPVGVAKGWDLADAEADGWDYARTTEYLRTHAVAVDSSAADIALQRQAEPVGQAAPAATCVDRGGWPFTPLGYDHGTYFYLSTLTGQVEKITSTAHTGANLLRLAGLDFWEMNYPGKSGASWTRAADACMQACHERGVYDPDKVRGRGAWEDDGRVVLHLGDQLVVDGEGYCIADIPGSKYVYEMSRPLGLEWDSIVPLGAGEAVQLMMLCNMLSWEKPVYGMLLAGWCVVAPVCGALSWRPHIWVTGPSGAGKSWTYDNILRRTLGKFALACQSNSTEAGLRQALKADAMPIIFDEAEGEDQQDRRRIQNVLELMRQASSENGAAIIKGSSSGEAMQYRIRSCFAFSSIGVSAVQKADVSRLAVLSLRKYDGPDRAEKFRDIQRFHAELFTGDFVPRLHKRTIGLVPTLRHNADVFADAAALELGSRRYGDQVGALLAGAYSLQSDARVTPAEAAEWVAGQEWGETMDNADDDDENRCIELILHKQLRVETQSGVVTRTVAELARVALKLRYDAVQALDAVTANDTLARHGVCCDADGYICVSDSHPAIADTLKNSPWAQTWPRLLRRINGATPRDGVDFGGKDGKATAVPASELFSCKNA